MQESKMSITNVEAVVLGSLIALIAGCIGYAIGYLKRESIYQKAIADSWERIIKSGIEDWDAKKNTLKGMNQGLVNELCCRAGDMAYHIAAVVDDSSQLPSGYCIRPTDYCPKALFFRKEDGSVVGFGERSGDIDAFMMLIDDMRQGIFDGLPWGKHHPNLAKCHLWWRGMSNLLSRAERSHSTLSIVVIWE